MAAIKLEFSQFGDFDSFSVLRSETPMNTESLPSPIASGLPTMYYEDTAVTKGGYYYYRVQVWRDGVSYVSSEVGALAGELWTPANMVVVPKIWISADTDIVVTDSHIKSLTNKGSDSLSFVQSSSIKAPLLKAGAFGDYNGIDFDGYKVLSTNFMTTTNGVSKVWVSLVLSVSALADSEKPVVFYLNNNGGTRLGISVLDSSRIRIATRFSVFDPLQALFVDYVVDDKLMIYASFDATTKKSILYINGNKVSESGLTSSASAYQTQNPSQEPSIGGLNNEGSFNGVLADYMLGTVYLPTSIEIDTLFGFLAHKYSLVDKLPASHPYKNIMPLL